MERIQSLQFWFVLGPNLLPENQKYCLKPKISGKSTSLGISNNISPRSKRNNIILVKLTKNKFFGPKLGINCSLRPHQRVIRNCHIAYNRTIHLYFLDTKFQLLSSCCFWLHLEETPMFFFVQDPSGPIFLFFIYFILFIFWVGRGVGDNNSSKQRQIELSKGSPYSCTNSYERDLRSSNFYRKFLKYPKFWVFGPTLTQFTSYRWTKSKVVIRLSK